MKRLSTLFYLLVIACSATGQIPNPGFTSWTYDTAGGGYLTPNGWVNPNPYTTLEETYVCERGTPGLSGPYYLKLTSKINPLAGPGTVIPGMAGTGIINQSNYGNITGGFPFASRPASLTGIWQYSPANFDTGNVIVYLFKWNAQSGAEDTVAYANQILAGSATTWTAFSIELNYYSGAVPDSAMILLSASKLPYGGREGSYLYVDTLAFAGNVPSGVVTIKNNAAPTVIYPNPSTGYANVFYYSISGGNLSVSICDISGKKLKTFNTNASVGANTLQVNVSDLATGTYVVNITDALGGIEGKKLIVQ